MRGSTYQLFYLHTRLSIRLSMLEIIQANKRHLPILKKLTVKLPEKELCKDPSLLYLACTVLRKYSLIAVEGGEAKGFLLALQATEHNYLWLHQLMVEPGIYERNLSRKLLFHLEDLLKSAWNTPVKSIKVALEEQQVLEKEFFENLKYKFTRNDEALGKEIFQKRVVL